MDECTADAFVNREEPIPVIAIPGNDVPPSDTKGKRERLNETLRGTSSRIKDKMHEHGANSKDQRQSIQDRLFTK